MSISRKSELQRPGILLLGILLCALSGALAVPQVTFTAIDSAGVFRLRMSGKGFPEIKSIAMNFSYDPLRVNIGNATVSTALSSTALGANLDTVQKRLVLTLAAASTVSVADGSSLAAIRAPECSFGSMTHAIQLLSASATDKSGNPLTVQVVDGGTPIRAFLPNQPVAVSANTNGMNRMISLNGRYCASTMGVLASGCWIVNGASVNGVWHTGTVVFSTHK
jgi:hypothetical protein